MDRLPDGAAFSVFARQLPALSLDCRFSLPPAEGKGLLELALESRFNPYEPSDTEYFIRESQQGARAVFSQETLEVVASILDDGYGVVAIEELPVDPDLPSTPSAIGSLSLDYKSTFVSEFVLVALGVLMGADLFNFRQEGRGSATLFDNVVAVPHLKKQKGAGGFSDDFPFHSESAWHRARPDYLALVGLRAEVNALTLVNSATTIAQTDLVERMPADSFSLKPPQLYSQMVPMGIPLGTPDLRLEPPLQTPEKLTLKLNFNGTDCKDKAALEWLSSLEDHIESTAVGGLLSSGTALLLNNAALVTPEPVTYQVSGPKRDGSSVATSDVICGRVRSPSRSCRRAR